MRAKNCPFCGCTPAVSAYPNGLGFEVQCENENCEMWGHKFDLTGWNKRAKVRVPVKYFFKKLAIWRPAVTPAIDTYEYQCQECGCVGVTSLRNVQHKEDCAIGRYLEASRSL